MKHQTWHRPWIEKLFIHFVPKRHQLSKLSHVSLEPSPNLVPTVYSVWKIDTPYLPETDWFTIWLFRYEVAIFRVGFTVSNELEGPPDSQREEVRKRQRI